MGHEVLQTTTCPNVRIGKPFVVITNITLYKSGLLLLLLNLATPVENRQQE